MRAATTLVPALQASGIETIPKLWRGNEWMQADPRFDGMSTGFAALDRELPGQGWPHGQLVELLIDRPGIGELGLLLPALATVARSGATCVWVLPSQAQDQPAQQVMQTLPYAPALADAGIDLARNIFVKPLTARESGWALEQSLRAAHLGALVGWLPESTSTDADFRFLRRLHLLAQRHRAVVFVLRAARHASAPSPAALRLQLQHQDDRLQVTVLKRRGRPLLEPVAIQVHPSHWNRPQIPATAPAPIATRETPSKTPSSLLQKVQALAPTWPSMQPAPGY
jgi:hypothetical protein